MDLRYTINIIATAGSDQLGHSQGRHFYRKLKRNDRIVHLAYHTSSRSSSNAFVVSDKVANLLRSSMTASLALPSAAASHREFARLASSELHTGILFGVVDTNVYPLKTRRVTHAEAS